MSARANPDRARSPRRENDKSNRSSRYTPRPSEREEEGRRDWKNQRDRDYPRENSAHHRDTGRYFSATRRSRSRSPRRRSRTPSPQPHTKQSNKLSKKLAAQQAKKKSNSAPAPAAPAEDEDDETKLMRSLGLVVSFNSTKGVGSDDPNTKLSGARVETSKRKFKQYMNKKGKGRAAEGDSFTA
jgi:hypothetical protein